MLCLTTFYLCPSILDAYQKFQGGPEVLGVVQSLEVNLELTKSREVSIEVKSKARAPEVTRDYSRSPENESQRFGGLR